MQSAIESQWFGDRSDEERRRSAARSLGAIAARVATSKPLPAVANRVHELASSADGSIIRVARVLEGDAVLSARLLRLVNSAGYALRVKCSSVRHAVVLAGLDNVRNLVTSASVLQMFQAESGASARVLVHCAQVGALSRYFGAYLSLPQEMLFTCGFMHDIGKLMLMEVREDEYASLLEATADEPDASCSAEDISFGFDHALLGATVLRKWRIPDPVPAVVEYHHDLAAALHVAGELAQHVAVVRMADAIAHELARGNAEPSLALCGGGAADYLGISGGQLHAMWADLKGLCARSHKLLDCHDTAWLERQSVVPPVRTRAPELVPSDSGVSVSEETGWGKEVPLTFPCHICGTASYGERCSACGGHVCPEHGGAREGWCELCAHNYALEQRRAWRRAPREMALVMAVALGIAAATGRATQWPPARDDVLGLALMLLLLGVLTAVMQKSLARRRFLREARSLQPSPAESTSSEGITSRTIESLS